MPWWRQFSNVFLQQSSHLNDRKSDFSNPVAQSSRPMNPILRKLLTKLQSCVFNSPRCRERKTVHVDNVADNRKVCGPEVPAW